MPRSSYNAYGVLVLRDAVCMGYALAYDYLLEQVGIKTLYCSSDALNHAWNIVRLGREYYNLDSTWDAGEDESYYDSREILKELYDNYLADMELYQASHESIIRSKKIFENIYSELNKENNGYLYDNLRREHTICRLVDTTDLGLSYQHQFRYLFFPKLR